MVAVTMYNETIQHFQLLYNRNVNNNDYTFVFVFRVKYQ